MSTRPIRESNAIDQIAFVILFEKAFDDQAIIKLIGLKQKLEPLLPACELVTRMEVKVEGINPGLPTSKIGGVVYSKKTADDARLEWSLRANANELVVTCSEYTNWSDVSTKAQELLFFAIDEFDLEENPITEIVYQCVDKFQRDEAPDDYSIGEVFDEQSRYLNTHARENPYSWHIHQGWFAPLQSDYSDALNNLNLNVIIQPDDKSSHETIINHLITVKQVDNKSKVESIESLKGTSSQTGYLEQVMSDAHTLNKSVIRGLLTKDMLNTIGLGAGDT